MLVFVCAWEARVEGKGAAYDWGLWRGRTWPEPVLMLDCPVLVTDDETACLTPIPVLIFDPVPGTEAEALMDIEFVLEPRAALLGGFEGTDKVLVEDGGEVTVTATTLPFSLSLRINYS